MSRDHALRLGFIALNDAATMIVAKAQGYFADEGLSVTLSREVSWATVRDKIKVGALDGAHMLAPTALAVSLGVGGDEPTPLLAPFALNLNGPAITLSSHLADVIGPGPTAEGLARLIARRRDEGASALTLAVVFPFSTHNYLLRDWLARSGIDPDRDVRLTVAPPSRMTELLAGGVVEGFCVTEPWNAAAGGGLGGRVRTSTAVGRTFVRTRTCRRKPRGCRDSCARGLIARILCVAAGFGAQTVRISRPSRTFFCTAHRRACDRTAPMTH